MTRGWCANPYPKPHKGTWREDVEEFRCMRHAPRKPLKVKGESRFPHRRNPEFIVWVKTLPCCLTGTWPVDPAHVKTRGAGGDDVGNVVPLNHDLHMALHSEGIESFQANRSVDLFGLAQRYARRWTKVNL